MPLLVSLAAMAAILGAASLAGWIAAAAILPPGAAFRVERLAWGFAGGLLVLALPVPVALLVGGSPGVGAYLLVAAMAAAAGLRFRLTDPAPAAASSDSASSISDAASRIPHPVSRICLVFAGLCIFGIAVYALEALTEPMWSLDFLAIWGLKGKILFALRAIPTSLLRDPAWSFSHPEYPLGLPFVYAGLAFLLGRWDDHAMALLFPCLQLATLLGLFGWLRRRGAARPVAMGAVALLALFAPLYSAFHTGLADIPLSFVLLLLGTSLTDLIDETDSGAVRRLAFASVLAVSTKNEGLFAVITALILAAVALRGERRARALAALLVPAAAVLALHRVVVGGAALKDFDFGLLAPSRWGALLGRQAEAIGVATREVALPASPGLAAATMIFLAGRRTPYGDRLLLLAGASAAAYVLLPGFAVLPGQPELGPPWLVRTALARTCAALAPLLAAGLAARLPGR